MRLSVRTGVGVVAGALAATLLVAGCSADADSDDATPEATQSAADESAAPEETEETGPVDVPDVTNLLLETAQGNLMRAGLEAEVVDESGAPVTVDDATTFRVTAQDPSEGTLEPGETVTLTVEARG